VGQPAFENQKRENQKVKKGGNEETWQMQKFS
jgi:hypothetical protein